MPVRRRRHCPSSPPPRRRRPVARGELAGGGRQELAHRRSLEERATAVAELAWRRSPLLYSGSELLLLRASAPPSPGALPLLRSICKLGRPSTEKREKGKTIGTMCFAALDLEDREWEDR